MTPAKKQSITFTSELVRGLWRENPIFVVVLGMCPTLAVTNTVINGFAMSAATIFVLVCSSAFVSLLRNYIPSQVRISAYIVIIATFVTVVDFTLEAIVPDIHRELGAFIPLIVVNCIILGRAEAFANKNPLKLAVGDALGMGFGFALALFLLSSAREMLGNGSFMGISIFGPNFEPWVIMILPPGGFLMLGFWLLTFASVKEARRKRAAEAQGKAA
jgi:electron transport complex protein RnfE